jgi:hypothetical protein
MKNCNPPENRTTRGILPIACATALAVASTVCLPQPAHAHEVTPPRVPADIQVPPGNEAFLVGHAVGTQNYVCQASGSGFAWILFTPQATLFSDRARQVTTHFFSPNPFETDPIRPIRATWQHSRDTSTVWGKDAIASSDPDFVEEGAIPWVRLTVDPKTGVQDGPTGGDTLTATTFIHRLNTHGGSAPSKDCAVSADVGRKAFVPYTADYFFYTDHRDTDHHDGDHHDGDRR